LGGYWAWGSSTWLALMITGTKINVATRTTSMINSAVQRTQTSNRLIT
jgi:hypothetical protein